MPRRNKKQGFKQDNTTARTYTQGLEMSLRLKPVHESLVYSVYQFMLVRYTIYKPQTTHTIATKTLKSI